MNEDCGVCSEQIDGSYIELNHVSYNGDMASFMKGTMRVHPHCYDEMKEDDSWDWPGK